ncbi:hypothetical protein AVEN_256191-1 [Araneus ventricosus]|uniref:ATP-dependent RNA helicase DDX46 n=1 Tax=Araneus ventricosus TaxID=182803 RepID=A0A4Y2TKM7_ARAVE|nr:hypothetical protein AVEN_256191-1 [Araneus ventricosus]
MAKKKSTAGCLCETAARSKSRSRDRERDRRRRSRSRDRRDRRSRSRDRRELSRGRDRRDRSRDRRGSSKDRSSKKDKEERRKDEDKNNTDLGDLKFDMLDKEAQNKQLELEMQKRRERIEKWRAERKKKEIAEGVTSATNVVVPSVKKWTLEDDDDEDIPPVVETEKTEAEEKPEKKEIKEEEKEKMEVEDDVDPLDAYMQGIQEEVKQLHHNNVKKGDSEEKGGAKVTMIVGMAKKKSTKSKGELMEQDQDALEYSSEEGQMISSQLCQIFKYKAKLPYTTKEKAVAYQPFVKLLC